MSRNKDKRKYKYLPLILRVLKEHKSLVHFSIDSDVNPIVKNEKYNSFLAASNNHHSAQFAILMGIHHAKLRSNVFYGYLSEFFHLLSNNKYTSQNIEKVEERMRLFYSVLPIHEKALIKHFNNKSYNVPLLSRIKLWIKMKKIMRNT